MAHLLCPVCGKNLIKEDKRWYCREGHSFDRAAGGYVNLLISRQSGSQHGDDKEMVRARREFLSGGYYEPLKNAVCLAVKEGVKGDCPEILDSGCGECYYTSAVEESLLSAGKKPHIIGIDISKDALKAGCKRGRELCLAVASAYRLPVEEDSTDIVLNVFAPFAGEEYLRVLKKGGRLIHVSPDERHLWELKRAVYEKPYLNDAPAPSQEGLELCGEKSLKYTFEIHSNKDIKALFMMTPYAHKTSERDIARLDSLDEITLSAEFIIRSYIKK